MKELSPGARALFDAARRSLQPSAEDRERVLRALSGRIGGPDGAGVDAPGVSAGTTSVGWFGLAALVVGLAVVGTGVVVLVRHDASPGPAPSLSAKPPATALTTVPSQSPPSAVSQVPVVNEALPAGTPESPRGAKRPSPSAQPSDRLAEEVALLSQAEQDLHAGQNGAALQVLAEHQRKFPRGILAEERIAAQAQALCGLGRVSEAERALARLSSKSPHQDAARKACAATHSE